MGFTRHSEFPALPGFDLFAHGFVWHQGPVQMGQIKVPPGYHPIDVEKEWGRLHVAILEREKLLRSEFERWDAAFF